MAGLSPAELVYIARSDLMDRWLVHLGLQEERLPVVDWKSQEYHIISLIISFFYLNRYSPVIHTRSQEMFLEPVATRSLAPHRVDSSPILREMVLSSMGRVYENIQRISNTYCYYPKAAAPAPELLCNDRGAVYQQDLALNNASIKRVMVGFDVSKWRPSPVSNVWQFFFILLLANIILACSGFRTHTKRGRFIPSTLLNLWFIVYLDAIIQQVAFGQWQIADSR